ncbi:MAG: type II toxin-antitoxin system PemK/MazF family toxin [Patescibacteria group bacterium]
MHKGKIVLVPFPFTDLSGHKVRPALVLQADVRGDNFIVCFISSRENKESEFNIKVKASSQSGLKVDSIIKVSKIATLEKRIALGEIGILESKIIKEVDKKLKIIFDL